MGIRVPNFENDSNGMRFEEAYIAVSTNSFMMTPRRDKASYDMIVRYSIWYSQEARLQGKGPVELRQVTANCANPASLGDLYASVYSVIKQQYPLGVDDEDQVATAPVEDEAPTDAPVEDEAPTDAPLEDEAPTDAPVEDEAPTDAPVEDEAPTDAPVDDGVVEEAPTDAPVEDEAPAEAPVEDVP